MAKPFQKLLRYWVVEMGLFEWACIKRALFNNWWLTTMNSISLPAGIAAAWILLRHQEWTAQRQALTTFLFAAIIPTSAAVMVSIWRLAISPFLVFQDAKNEAERRETTLDKELTSLRDKTLSEEQLRANECFEMATTLLKDEEVFSFHALFKAGGHLPSNDLVVAVCNRLVENGHFHPFSGLASYVLESEYSQFLEYVRYHADNTHLNPSEGIAYLNSARTWLKKQGRPEPPLDQSLDMIFNTVFEHTNPRGKIPTKGLKVSIEPYIENTTPIAHRGHIFNDWQLTARVIFINTGKVQRTVLGAQFVYCEPNGPLSYRLLGGVRYEGGNDSDATTPIVINPDGSEVVVSYRTFLDYLDAEKPNGKFGIMITASDGKGGPSRDTFVMLITVRRNGHINHTLKRPLNVSLDEDNI
jgi:hypothetical protein